MILRRLIVAVPVIMLLTLVSFATVPSPQVGDAVRFAGLSFDEKAVVAAETAAPTVEPTPTQVPSPTVTLTPIPTSTRPPTPTATRDLRLQSARVPILMYHYLSVPPPDADVYRLDLSVTPANFEAQMKYLKAEGYTPIRVSDLSASMLEGKPLPKKPIILTFDDGYADNYEFAFPILKKYKFVATFFVVAGFIDEKRPGYMNWDQLEEMAIEGHEIGSHTLSHPDLKGKSAVVQDTEIAGAKLLIESRIGTPVTSFCYPASKYDSRTLATLRSTGYLAAVTEISGTRQTLDKILELQRIRVRGSYSVADFAYWIKYWLSK